MANVLTHITQVMVDIARSKPEDPIKYMADKLLHQAGSMQEQAEANAFNNFYKILNETESRPGPT